MTIEHEKKQSPRWQYALMIAVAVAGLAFSYAGITWGYAEIQRLRSTEWMDVSGPVKKFHRRHVKGGTILVFRPKGASRWYSTKADFDPESITLPVEVRTRVAVTPSIPFLLGVTHQRTATFGLWLNGVEILSHEASLSSARRHMWVLIGLTAAFALLCVAVLCLGAAAIRGPSAPAARRS